MRPSFVLLPLFGITIASPAANSETPSWEYYTGATIADYMDTEKHRLWNNRVRIEVVRYVQLPGWTAGVDGMKESKLWGCVEKNEANKRNWVPANGPVSQANWSVDWRRVCKQWL